jgi:hypothetical protein
MKYLFFTTVLAFSGYSGYSQDLNVVSAAGNYSENASGSVAWTIGEAVIITGTGVSNDATQGFHQHDVAILGVEELATLDISIYPNPTSDVLHISSPNDIKLTIYDMNARLVSVYYLGSETTLISVDDLSRGIYNMVFESADQETKTVKLVVQ